MRSGDFKKMSKYSQSLVKEEYAELLAKLINIIGDVLGKK